MSTVVTPNLVLGPELAGISLTPEEFDAIQEADRDYRYQLINGRLIVTPPPLEAERATNQELGFLLRLYRHEHHRGMGLRIQARLAAGLRGKTSGIPRNGHRRVLDLRPLSPDADRVSGHFGHTRSIGRAGRQDVPHAAVAGLRAAVGPD